MTPSKGRSSALKIVPHGMEIFLGMERTVLTHTKAKPSIEDGPLGEVELTVFVTTNLTPVVALRIRGNGRGIGLE